MEKELENAHIDYEKRKLSTLYDLGILNKALYYYYLQDNISKEAYKSFNKVIKTAINFIKEKEI